MQNPRFLKYYQYVVVEDFLLTLNINNVMQFPQPQKLVLNTSSKLYVLDKKAITRAFAALQLVAAQMPRITLAHNSIAAFKLRQDNLLGCKVSVRGAKMYILLEKLLIFVFPRIRELGVQRMNEFDNFGNLNLGLNHLLLFNELQPFFSFFDLLQGTNISIVMCTAQNSRVCGVYKKKHLYHNLSNTAGRRGGEELKIGNNKNFPTISAVKKGEGTSDKLKRKSCIFFTAFQYP